MRSFVSILTALGACQLITFSCASGLTERATNAAGESWTESKSIDAEIVEAHEPIVREALIRNKKSNSWTTNEVLALKGRKVFSIFFADERNGWIGGTEEIFKTTNAGLSWQQIRPGVPERYIVSFVRFRDERTGWLVAESGEGASMTSEDRAALLMKTIDGGLSWSTAGAWKSVVVTGFFMTAHSGWIGGIRYLGFSQENHTGNFLLQLKFDSQWIDRSDILNEHSESTNTGIVGVGPTFDGNVLVVTANGEIFRSVDNERSWEFVGSYDPRGNRVEGIVAGSRDLFFLVDGSCGREGIGSRVIKFGGDLQRKPIEISLLPGYFIKTTSLFRESDIVAIMSMSCESREDLPDGSSIITSEDHGKTWDLVLSLDSKARRSSLSTAGPNNLFGLIDDRIIRLTREFKRIQQ